MLPDWEIWLDNHISSVIAKKIRDEFGLVAKSSYVLKLAELDDIDIYHLAKAAGNIIVITKDGDFENIVKRLGAPPKILNIGFGNGSNQMLWAKLKPKLLFTIDVLVSMDIDFIQID